MASFVPRSVFHASHDLPRTYFLGHHRAGLDQMKRMLTSVDTVIECRDYRIPATSINPMFEEALGGKQRYVVYTKRDLAGDSQRTKVFYICKYIARLSFTPLDNIHKH